MVSRKVLIKKLFRWWSKCFFSFWILLVNDPVRLYAFSFEGSHQFSSMLLLIFELVFRLIEFKSTDQFCIQRNISIVSSNTVQIVKELIERFLNSSKIRGSSQMMSTHSELFDLHYPCLLMIQSSQNIIKCSSSLICDRHISSFAIISKQTLKYIYVQFKLFIANSINLNMLIYIECCKFSLDHRILAKL